MLHHVELNEYVLGGLDHGAEKYVDIVNDYTAVSRKVVNAI